MVKRRLNRVVNHDVVNERQNLESFEGKCVVTYIYIYIELQHIKIPVIKKHEIAAKLS